MFVLISMLASAFLAHYNAPKFYGELEAPADGSSKLPRFNLVVGLGFLAAAGVMGAVMAGGFLTFGSASQGLILNSYATSDPLAFLARLGIGMRTAVAHLPPQRPPASSSRPSAHLQPKTRPSIAPMPHRRLHRNVDHLLLPSELCRSARGAARLPRQDRGGQEDLRARLAHSAPHGSYERHSSISEGPWTRCWSRRSHPRFWCDIARGACCGTRRLLRSCMRSILSFGAALVYIFPALMAVGEKEGAMGKPEKIVNWALTLLGFFFAGLGAVMCLK